MNIRPVTMEFLKDQGALLIDHIQDGFDNYPYFVVHGDYLRFRGFIAACQNFNDGRAYFDFYYGQLDQEQQNAFLAGISAEERQALELLAVEKGQIFYPLQQEVLPFISDITARGWLFSSFYFTKHPCIIWGNYNMDYPVFCKNEEDLNSYIDIAKSCGL